MAIATTRRVDAEGLREFLATRRNLVLLTYRADGGPQLSPVTGAQAPDGRILVASYPRRAKSVNLARDPRCSLLALGEDFGDAWVQIDGTGEVIGGEEGSRPSSSTTGQRRGAPGLGGLPARDAGARQGVPRRHARAVGAGRHRRHPARVRLSRPRPPQARRRTDRDARMWTNRRTAPEGT
ncbi:MAG: pyridoxamine 5'-phosphate oxidase family protein [Kineosporiaceae bacterium]